MAQSKTREISVKLYPSNENYYSILVGESMMDRVLDFHFPGVTISQISQPNGHIATQNNQQFLIELIP